MSESPANATITGNTLQPIPQVSEYDVTELYGAIHNDRYFRDLLAQPGHKYIPELVVAYYSRGNFIGGIGPQEVMKPEEPLYEKLFSIDLDQVEDPNERQIFKSLQQAIAQRETYYSEEPGIGRKEQNIAAQFVPGIMKKHDVNTAETLLLRFNEHYGQRYDAGTAAVYADTLSAVKGFVTQPQKDVDPFQRVHLAARAEQVGELFAKRAIEMGDSPETVEAIVTRSAELEKMKEGILIDDFGMSPEDMKVILADPTVNNRVMENGQALKRATQIIAGLRRNERLRRLVQESSPAFADFYLTFDVAVDTGLDFEALAKVGSGFIAKNYAQASKLTAPSAIKHYADRVSGFVKDIAVTSMDSEIWARYTGFIEKTGSMSAKEETRAVQLFKTASKLGKTDLPEEITSLDKFEEILIDNFIGELTDGKRTLSGEQRQRLVERFGTIAPLLTYGQQYMGTPEFKEALSGLTISVADGSYEEWHSGNGSPGALEEMIKAGYLPEHMSPKQYEQWISDSESDSREQMVGSAEDTAQIIRDTVENASDDVAGIASGYAFELENLPVVINERNGLGRLLGLLNRSAKGAERPLQDEEIDALESDLGEMAGMGEVSKFITSLRDGSGAGEVAGQIVSIRSELDQLGLLIRIANLDAEEVAAGALLKEPAEDGSRKIQERLEDLLDNLVRELPTDLQFIPKSVSTLLESHAQTNGHQELFSVEDTIDPKVTLEIGAVPQRSCQHYETGSHNEGLIGYFGPDVKILIVRNAKGGIVGRSIMRLMQDENGMPVLYTEPVYQSLASTQVSDMLNDHAESKAAAMGVEVYGTRSGRVEGFKDLKVRTLKMPAAYSDTSEGIGIERGSLNIRTTVVA